MTFIKCCNNKRAVTCIHLFVPFYFSIQGESQNVCYTLKYGSNIKLSRKLKHVLILLFTAYVYLTDHTTSYLLSTEYYFRDEI